MTVAVVLRGAWVALGMALVASAQGADAPPAAPAQKVMRYAFPVAETGFDPAQITDVYSRIVAANIFEAPLTYDFLARPVALKPGTTVGLPEISPDFRRFTFRIKPGIHFADDPAFKGQKRELVAADYVYAIKRHYDPRWKSGNLYIFENAKILGLSELRARALKNQTPFDYDTEVEGLKTIDRYTFVVTVAEPMPRLAYQFADSAVAGAVAREVIEADPDHAMQRPVGTGPYRLAEWRRSSLIVLERNPNYREVFYDATPPAGDATSQAIAQRLKGQRLPLIDRVEVAIVEESQPRLLAFLNAEHDWIERLPPELTGKVMANGRLLPNLEKRGLHLERMVGVDVSYSYFGMENPVVGGYTPEKVALRRAMSLAYDVQGEITLVRQGQGVPAQAIVPPQMPGYAAGFKSEMSEHDVGKARALLDLYGYTDRDGDGWRELPDGSPLVIEYAAQPDQQSRLLQEQWQRAMNALKIRIEFKLAKWPEQLKSSRAGKLMMWGVNWSATVPDASDMLGLMYGPNKGQSNHARFDLPAYNTLYERQSVLPDGPERESLIHEAKKLGIAYMPYKISAHRIVNDVMQPWVFGYRRHPYLRGYWQYLDIDPALRSRSLQP
ncbi:ABC transporter substrate-binding protein [Ideonella sp. DXS29W]|uniref:ABC transporter substrate-binding protein n=1 Tax=Ideonella lacteola TaxID=2984193 RepID=A0ABU9BPS8_9BURK